MQGKKVLFYLFFGLLTHFWFESLYVTFLGTLHFAFIEFSNQSCLFLDSADIIRFYNETL